MKYRHLSYILIISVLVFLVGCEKLQESTTAVVQTQPEITTEAPTATVAVSEYDEGYFDISITELYSRMENFRSPKEPYTINVTGLSVPVTLYMNLDCVTAIEAHGHMVTLEIPRDIYGNCNFDLFEYGGAVIIEGGYYGIGEVHVLSAEGTSTVRHKDNASYYLYVNDNGELYYGLAHNGIADIVQTGGLSAATGYDDFWRANGYAHIDGCNVVFDEPYESYVISDKYDLDKEFEVNYKQDYASIEEKFAENAAKYGVEVRTEVTTEATTAPKVPDEPKYITETDTFDFTVEDWTYTYKTPNYDAWAETEGEYVIWEVTKNSDGEFELTYSEGDILCIPYVKIGADKVIYSTTKTNIPPALEIGKPHNLKAHNEIGRLFLEDTLGGLVGVPVTDGIYAEYFTRYCEAEPEKADILRERSGKLRDVFKVYINGEAVDGIGVALPSYCFIKDYQREWQFLFSKAYAKEDVNTVRIELKSPDYQESTTFDVSQSEPASLLSGSCGEGVSYTFDTDSGEVRILGTGEMKFFDGESEISRFAPWHNDAHVKSVVIEDGVTSICDMAFYGCTGLSNVTIPQSVTSIGKDAFNSCHSLREISVPDSVIYIGDGAFTYCNSLKELVIPQGVTSISPSMFSACEKLEKITIPDSVTYIGNNAFERCNSLSEISIPSEVTDIGEMAFAYCTSLKEVMLPQGVTNLNRGTFYNCTALEKITLPEGLTSIGIAVFHGSDALLEITIPKSVTSIDETAFIYGNLSLVRAPLGSYAEQFAKDNNIGFEEVNDYVS